MKVDLVSAIITTRNRKVLLMRAIESVLAQTYSNIECIVVDDASSDETQSYCESCESIRYIRISEENSRGGNYARNLGIKEAKGKYIAFLDDDDCWLPEKIEKQVCLLKMKQCAFVYCGRCLEYVGKEDVTCEKELLSPLYEGNLSLSILTSICATTSTILVEKNILFEAGLFDEKLKFWQEYELTIRLAQLTHFYFVDEPLCVYRIDSSDSQRLTNKYYLWKRTVLYIREKHEFLYAKLGFSQKIQYYRMVLRDAALRCKNSRLYVHYCFFKLVSASLKIISFLV